MFPSEPPDEFRHSLADQLAQFVWAADAGGRVVYFNPHWYEYTGLTSAQSLADGWTAAVAPEDLPAVRPICDRGLSAGTAVEFEARFRRSDGGLRWHLARVTSVKNAAGQIVRWVGSAVDIEDRRRADSAVRDAGRHKEEFLAILGHELRGPLAPLRSGLEVLKRAGSANAVVGPTIAMMERQMFNLIHLVDDLLDVSRISRGKIKLHSEPLDLREAVDRAVETVRPFIDARSHALTVDLPAEPLPVNGDPARLTQVMNNLLHNAAKYTPERGRLRLTANREGDTAVVTLCDSGIGILPEILPTIFDLFSQGQRAADSTPGGLGIGLAVVKSLVEMHGGTVKAGSDGPDCGSQFIVRLPLSGQGLAAVQHAKPHAGGAEKPPTIHARSLRLLVVDDNIDTTRLTCLLLQQSGHDARPAHDGPAALAVAATFHPDAVLLDIGLPGLNGYEVGDRLRAMPGLERVKLVAITGFGHDEDRRRSEQAGFVGHLIKPVEPAALEDILAHLAAEQDQVV